MEAETEVWRPGYACAFCAFPRLRTTDDLSLTGCSALMRIKMTAIDFGKLDLRSRGRQVRGFGPFAGKNFVNSYRLIGSLF